MNTQQFVAQYPRVTRATVDTWLADNRPQMATDEINGSKGIYRKDMGQAASFRTLGQTWREVLQALTVDSE